jgi:hypothetical protein
VSLPRLGVAIVTMGTRPRELKALLASVEKQTVAATRVMLVGNATPLTDVDAAANMTKIPREENLGCPGGRNVGLERLRTSDEVDVVIELDDDGLLTDTDAFLKVQQHFAADPHLGKPGQGRFGLPARHHRGERLATADLGQSGRLPARRRAGRASGIRTGRAHREADEFRRFLTGTVAPVSAGLRVGGQRARARPPPTWL